MTETRTLTVNVNSLPSDWRPPVVRASLGMRKGKFDRPPRPGLARHEGREVLHGTLTIEYDRIVAIDASLHTIQNPQVRTHMIRHIVVIDFLEAIYNTVTYNNSEEHACCAILVGRIRRDSRRQQWLAR